MRSGANRRDLQRAERMKRHMLPGWGFGWGTEETSRKSQRHWKWEAARIQWGSPTVVKWNLRR